MTNFVKILAWTLIFYDLCHELFMNNQLGWISLYEKVFGDPLDINYKALSALSVNPLMDKKNCVKSSKFWAIWKTKSAHHIYWEYNQQGYLKNKQKVIQIKCWNLVEYAIKWLNIGLSICSDIQVIYRPTKAKIFTF